MYAPYDLPTINNIVGRFSPNWTTSVNTDQFNYWQRSLFQRAISKIDFNLSDNFNGQTMDFFKFALFSIGYLAVYEDIDFGGVVFQPCTLSGQNFFYQFNKVLINNPVYNDSGKELIIGEDVELIKLTPDYKGIFDIINRYAELLALLDSAINISIINLKVPDIFTAKNKASALALQKALDQINKGKPAVFIDKEITNDRTDKSEPWNIIDRGNVMSKYITTNQLIDQQTILNNFDSEIGITTVPYQKKERMVTNEADSREEDSTSRLTTWLNCLNESFKEVNKHFGVNWSCKEHKIETEPDQKEGEELE